MTDRGAVPGPDKSRLPNPLDGGASLDGRDQIQQQIVETARTLLTELDAHETALVLLALPKVCRIISGYSLVFDKSLESPEARINTGQEVESILDKLLDVAGPGGFTIEPETTQPLDVRPSADIEATGASVDAARRLGNIEKLVETIRSTDDGPDVMGPAVRELSNSEAAVWAFARESSKNTFNPLSVVHTRPDVQQMVSILGLDRELCGIDICQDYLAIMARWDESRRPDLAILNGVCQRIDNEESMSALFGPDSLNFIRLIRNEVVRDLFPDSADFAANMIAKSDAGMTMFNETLSVLSRGGPLAKGLGKQIGDNGARKLLSQLHDLMPEIIERTLPFYYDANR